MDEQKTWLHCIHVVWFNSCLELNTWNIHMWLISEIVSTTILSVFASKLNTKRGLLISYTYESFNIHFLSLITFQQLSLEVYSGFSFIPLLADPKATVVQIIYVYDPELIPWRPHSLRSRQLCDSSAGQILSFFICLLPSSPCGEHKFWSAVIWRSYIESNCVDPDPTDTRTDSWGVT